MSEFDRQRQGKRYEGWAFTFCKAAFLVLLCGRYALFVLSALATVFYILAAMKGVREWRCWAKPPYVTLFWAILCLFEAFRLWGQASLPLPALFRYWG
ncbi:MAG: hypothetical protein SFU56_10150 [Capsulimonadales bacterium]|nr:hypothetical protein [Capsulimonadales bacterium]